MSHRADQVVDAAVDAIASFVPSTVSVYAHRRLSLAEDQDELPGITVDYGEDVPVASDGSDLLDGSIESLLTLNVTGIAIEFDEKNLRRKLLDLRSYVHQAIQANQGLQLPFVIDVHYGGALPPDISIEGDQLSGELTSQWGVRYEMKPNTPE